MILRITTRFALLIFTVLMVFLALGGDVFAQSKATQEVNEACKQAPNSTFCAERNQTNDPVANLLVDVINILLFAVGALAVVFVIYGGFKYVKSDGSSDKVSEAKKTIIYALVGLVVALIANRLIIFILNRFFN